MGDAGKCAVLVPVAGTIEPETDDALRVLIGRGYDVRALRGCSQVDLARSLLASDALRDGFEETLWVDADVVFDPDDVEKLRGHGRPFTAGLYRKKKAEVEFACKFMDDTRGATFGAGGGLLEVRYVGMGFTHVRRDVYEAVKRHAGLPDCTGGYRPGVLFTPYFIPSVCDNGRGGVDYLSDDFSFCHRAREAGFAVYADTTVRLGHMGRYAYGREQLGAAADARGSRLEMPGGSMIDRKTIEAQQAQLEADRARNEADRAAREKDIQAIDGALQLCRFWLAKIDADEAKAAKAEAEQMATLTAGVSPAEKNGEAVHAVETGQ